VRASAIVGGAQVDFLTAVSVAGQTGAFEVAARALIAADGVGAFILARSMSAT